LGSATITHPFHPLRGKRFAILKTRRVGGIDTLILRGSERGTFGVPAEWTDRADPPVRDRQPQIFDPLSLFELAELVRHLRILQK
jgi:hypothetical protein